MLILIIGVVLAIFLIFLGVWKILDNKFLTGKFSLMLAIVIAFLGLFIPSIIESPYFEDNIVLVEEIELFNLNDNDSNEICVIKTADGIYMYKKVLGEFNITEKVIEKEDITCKSPVLRIYKRDSQITLWSLGKNYKTEYELYVPINTIKIVNN